MRRLLFVFGMALFLSVIGSCTKKAADVIVGHWELEDNFYDEPNEIWEFDSDGTFRFMSDGCEYEGSYSVKGSDICLNYYNNFYDCQIIAKIISMNDNWMRWITSDDVTLLFSRIPISHEGN